MEIIEYIDNFLELCRLYNPIFSEEEYIVEEIDKKEANDLILKTVDSIIKITNTIKQGKLLYNENEFYKFLGRIINLNTEFHKEQNNKIASSVDRELQGRLFYNLKILNDSIIKWNKNHSNKIMTLKQAKEKFTSSLKEGVNYFPY